MTNTNVTTIMEAPKGYVVDFDNPQTNYVIPSYIVGAVEMVLAFMFLLQRLYTKVIIMERFQVEDSKSCRWPEVPTHQHA